MRRSGGRAISDGLEGAFDVVAGITGGGVLVVVYSLAVKMNRRVVVRELRAR